MIKSELDKRVKELGYPNLITSDILNKLSSRNHPLGRMPYYKKTPNSTICREEEIAIERYTELIDSYCNTFKVEAKSIVKPTVFMNAMISNAAAINKESANRPALCNLAEKIIREEWFLGEDEVIFDLEFVEQGNIELPKEMNMDSTLDDESKKEIESEIPNEIVKRRTINALAQGASLKGHYIFHLYQEEINNIIPDVTNLYQKALIANDLIYYLVDDDDFKGSIEANNNNNAGYVDLDFDGEIPKIIVKAINLPIMIHEMIKGVISLLSVAGLPKNKSKELIEYTDTITSELWDIRLFPLIWGNLNTLFDESDYDLKKLVLLELFKKSADDFINFMNKLENEPDMAKKYIEMIIKDKRLEIMEFEFNNSMDDIDLSDLGL